MVIKHWLAFKISKYSHKTLWLAFKIFEDENMRKKIEKILNPYKLFNARLWLLQVFKIVIQMKAFDMNILRL